jgi:hypothetical protein
MSASISTIAKMRTWALSRAASELAGGVVPQMWLFTVVAGNASFISGTNEEWLRFKTPLDNPALSYWALGYYDHQGQPQIIEDDYREAITMGTQPEPRFAALRRAIHAAVDAFQQSPAPFFIYSETPIETTIHRAMDPTDAHASFEALASSGYAALFDTHDPSWPDPVATASHRDADSVAVAGGYGHHVGVPAFEYGMTAAPDPWADTAAPAPTGPAPDPTAFDHPPSPRHKGGGGHGRHGVADPYNDQINHLADQIFWQETNYKPGQKLDPSDPSDHAMIPAWLHARAEAQAQVYAQVRNDPSAPAARRPSAPAMSAMSPGAGPGDAISSAASSIMSSGDPMNSPNPWLPTLNQAHLSVGAHRYDHRRAHDGWGNYRWWYRHDRFRPAIVGAVAPVIAPATGGVTGKLELDGNQVLHAEVCIDGKCYKGSLDLKGPIAAVLAQCASWHKAQHEAAKQGAAAVVGRWGGGGGFRGGGWAGWHGAPHLAPRWGRFGGGYSYYAPPYWYAPEMVEEVVATDPTQQQPVDPAQQPDSDQAAVEGAVQTAGEILVGQLVDQHIRIACAGWWHDLTHAVSKAVGGLEHDAMATLKALKGPIMTAAAAAVSAIPGLGPVVGPMAQKLTGALIDAATGTGGAASAAKAALEQAYQQAKSNPAVQQALNVAHQAAAQATAAAHLAQTGQAAAQGNPAAAQQVTQTIQTAQQGDPAAQQAATTMSQAGTGQTSCAPPVNPACIQVCAPPTTPIPPTPPGGPTITSSATQPGTGPLVNMTSAAQGAGQGSCAPACNPACGPAVQGWFAPLLFGAAGGFTGGHWSGARQEHAYLQPQLDETHRLLTLAYQEMAAQKHDLEDLRGKYNYAEPYAPPMPPAAVQGWPFYFIEEPRVGADVVGAAILELRQEAQSSVLDSAKREPGKVWCYVRNASTGGKGVSTTFAVGSADEADDWFGKLDPNTYLYAAYFDSNDPTWPTPLNEATGTIVKVTPAAPTASVGHWALPMLLGGGLGAAAAAGWDRREQIRKWFQGVAG